MSVSDRLLLAGRRAAAVRIGSVFVAVLFVCSCRDDPASEPPPPIDPRIWHFTQCVECTDNERARVVSMQDSAVPALRYLLLHGPPDSIVARYDSALRTPRPAAPPDRGVYSTPGDIVDRRVDDLVAFYRIRSSVALGLIGTDSARKTLCAGKGMRVRPDVTYMIDSSLKMLQGSCP